MTKKRKIIKVDIETKKHDTGELSNSIGYSLHEILYYYNEDKITLTFKRRRFRRRQS